MIASGAALALCLAAAPAAGEVPMEVAAGAPSFAPGTLEELDGEALVVSIAAEADSPPYLRPHQVELLCARGGCRARYSGLEVSGQSRSWTEAKPGEKALGQDLFDQLASALRRDRRWAAGTSPAKPSYGTCWALRVRYRHGKSAQLREVVRWSAAQGKEGARPFFDLVKRVADAYGADLLDIRRYD
jgi:hypothetical protein